MAEDFPKLKMEKDIQVHEAQKITNKINSNSPTPRHIIIKMAKKRILKAGGEKKKKKQRFNYKGITIRLSTNFSTETLQARRE